MTPDQIFATGVVLSVFVMLAATRLGPDLVLVAGLIVLMISGVLPTKNGLAGLSNEGIVAIGALYVVAAGIRETGGIHWIATIILGRPKSPRMAIARLTAPVAFMSAFLNNTPLVAMMIPAVNDWARRHQLSVSHLLMPLSFAAILGGTCTLIGTSTNLIVDDLLAASSEHQRMGLFEISWIGLPATVAGYLYLTFFAARLIPERRPARSEFENPREYSVEMLVEPESPLVGKTIENAGLRHLPGTFLAEIDRNGMVLPAVGPEVELNAGDRLVFVGIVESVIDLQKIRGLIPATNQVFKLESPRATRCMIEAVVSNMGPVVGKTIRDARFRSHYKAVVVAVARNGQRIDKKIGDIVLQPGDTLLLEAHPSFVDEQRNSRDFLLVSRLEDSNPPQHDRALVAFAILLGMVLVKVLLGISILKVAIVAAGLMIITGCCSPTVARRSIDWQVLIAIAAAVGIGAAMDITGAAAVIAGVPIWLAQGNPWVTLAVVYLVTMVATEFITNVAAAALMFPLAMSAAAGLDVNHMPFVIAVMMAASASFSTPIGYQTNLMVYGPGGYHFSDYLRVGLPLGVIVWVITVVLAPIVWPFY